ncbi:glycosyltransferase 87 family protein [Sulfobacillus harzensis]|uniref:DUF2029 domain-containing protein n=1 Tax=Sulfobacillus harzensis TaxID=2729629 RepID=A0A7Y0L829_9FIRM|nr:glycosyltransferase 87 family protein [Sulfobacillus harzensis]NMP24906.1 DUF2029 domain-containing protein [Sulfobacillus harzensis]
MSHRRQWVLGSIAITIWYVWAAIRLIPPQPMLANAIPTHWWSWAYAHLAYTDIFALYHNHQLFNHALPYIQTPIEYPVLMGILMWIAAWAGSALGYYLVTALFLWMAALLFFRWLVQWSPKTAWGFSLTPMLLTYGLLNWDVIGLCLMMGAIWLFERGRYNASAVTFAAAVFFKFFPIFYLPYIAIALWRDHKRDVLGRMVAWFFGVSALINLPFAVANPSNWSLFYRFNAQRPVSTDLWNNVWIHLASVRAVDLISLLLVVAVFLISARHVWRGGSVYHAAALLFAIFLLVNKVFSPQYMLWLMGFGMIAEWPLWTFGLLSVGGVADYVNSMAILHLYNVGARSANWYAANIYPLGLLLRYLVIAASSVGAIFSRRQAIEADVPQTSSRGSELRY